MTLDGAVERITFYNPETGFTVLKLRLRGRRDPVAVVGTLPAVQPGELLTLTGQWHMDSRHGAQFQPVTTEIRTPTDAEGITRYLGSGLIRQIGPVLARRIVEVFGAATLEVLDTAPDRVREVPGIGRQRAEAIRDAWIEHRALRAIMAYLSANGLDTRFAPRLFRAYGPEAHTLLAANPYRLVAEVPGLGFATADRLGMAAGIRPTAPARLQAAVQAALLRLGENGHTRATRDELVALAAESAGVDAALVQAAVDQSLAGGALAVRGAGPAATAAAPVQVARKAGRLQVYEPVVAPSQGDEQPGIGLAGLVKAEEDLAARVLGLARRAALPPEPVAAWLRADPEAAKLSPEQYAAVRLAACSGLFVLTGGPGVGKTTTTRVLVHCLSDLGRSVALAAPTGRAAQRLGAVVGREARTLHRLLGSDPRGFHHGPREPLPFDTVIVDEASMLDTALARAVFRAIAPQAQLVLVGDAEQLPSIGPGQVLRDLLQSPSVPSARLTTVFRQAARSQIVVNAHRMREGLLPEFATPEALAAGADSIFIAASGNRVAEQGAYWASVGLPRALGVSPAEIQVLAPLTRVCQALNAALQARLNPAQGQPERPHGALALRQGDRVIQTRNNYDLGVFNGDIGTLVAVADDALQVDFADGRLVTYTPADLLDLDHAYCLTVHRAQGSEWPGAVVLASSSFGPMLTRNLLYTALTRARRAVVVVGDQQAIARAVAETRDQNRRTGLASLLAQAAPLPIDLEP